MEYVSIDYSDQIRHLSIPSLCAQRLGIDLQFLRADKGDTKLTQ